MKNIKRITENFDQDIPMTDLESADEKAFFLFQTIMEMCKDPDGTELADLLQQMDIDELEILFNIFSNR